jgi:serine/threonine-protein kinase
VCSALDAAHAQAIVHRDIKPSNVFLVEEDGRRRVVLLDFGVAKLLDAPGPSLTSSRQMVGTLSYMSPEQIQGKAVESRTDVYALGALLFAMLVGEAPSPAAAYPSMREILLPAGALRPSLRAPVHPAFDEVVLRAMSSDRAARHPSAAAFLAHARWAADQDPGSAGVVSEGRRRRALGVYVEILVDASVMAAPDSALLADFEGILPAAHEHLAAAGMSLAVETGNGALFVADRSGDPARDEEARRALLIAARSLHRRFEARGGRDPRVRVHVSVHAGEILASDAGDPVGGDLLDLSARIPEAVPAGTFAAAAVLAGLDSGVHATGPLVQIA